MTQLDYDLRFHKWKIYLMACVLPLAAYVLMGKLRRGIIVTVLTLVMLIPLYEPISKAGMYYFLFYYETYGMFGLLGMLIVPVVAIIIPIIDVSNLIRKK